MSGQAEFNGETIYRTALLEWIQVDPNKWTAKPPGYPGTGERYKCIIYEQMGKFYLTFEDHDLPEHREPFETFFNAVFWAESVALRRCAGRNDSQITISDALKTEMPAYIDKYFNGCRAVAIFAPFRNQGMTAPDEQIADKKDYFKESSSQ